MKKFILIFLTISVFAFTDAPSNEKIEELYKTDPIEIYDMVRALYDIEHCIPEISSVQFAAIILGDDLVITPIEPYITIKIVHLQYAVLIPEQEFEDIIPRRKLSWWVIPTVFVGGISIGLLLSNLIGGK